jgi:hypothetical protein
MRYPQSQTTRLEKFWYCVGVYLSTLTILGQKSLNSVRVHTLLHWGEQRPNPYYMFHFVMRPVEVSLHNLTASKNNHTKILVSLKLRISHVAHSVLPMYWIQKANHIPLERLGKEHTKEIGHCNATATQKRFCQSWTWATELSSAN